jgi:phage terminase small subunit
MTTEIATVERIRLTPQQEAFAREYVRLGNASRAYRAAYKLKPDIKPETVWESASRTLANHKVRARVDEIRAKAVDEMIVDRNRVTLGLITAHNLALENEQPAAAVSAMMGVAKVNGLIVDRHEHTGKDGAAIAVEAQVSEREQSAFAIGRRLAWLLAQGQRRVAQE